MFIKKALFFDCFSFLLEQLVVKSDTVKLTSIKHKMSQENETKLLYMLNN